jgi:transmembrane sensor
MIKFGQEHASDPDYKHPDAAVDQALDWFLRRQSDGGDHPGQEVDFLAWLAADPAHAKAWDDVSATWNAPETLVSAKLLDPWSAIEANGLKHVERRWPSRRLIMAGSAVALAASLVLTAALPMVSRAFLPRLLADYTTQTGEKREILLPDGSRMILNTHSAVALDFEDGKRGVRLLEGEAWFDVVHDPARPFHVVARHIDTEVKGTAFSVTVESDLDTVRLQRGAIDATHIPSDADVVRLYPGQMVTGSDVAMSSVKTFLPEESLAWLENRIVLDNRSLGDALQELGRYFDGKIVVLNRELLEKRVSGFYRTDRAAAAIANIVVGSGGKIMRFPGDFLIIR